MSLAQLLLLTASDRSEQPDQIAAVSGARPDELETPVANDQLRVFAAGVPRAPAHTDVVHVRPESAQEFTTAFHLRDRTVDLILQVRLGRTVWRRRIPLPGPS